MKKLLFCTGSVLSAYAYAAAPAATTTSITPPASIFCTATNACKIDTANYQITNMSNIAKPTMFSLKTARAITTSTKPLAGKIVYSYRGAVNSYLTLQVKYPMPKSGVYLGNGSQWKGSVQHGYYCRKAELFPASCSWILLDSSKETSLPAQPD